MLTQDVLNLANDVAKTSLLNGARLKAIPGTALDAMVQNVTPAEGVVASQECLEHSLGTVIDKSYANFGFTEGAAIYQVYDSIEEQCINPLKNQLSFTRNVVSPVIREVIEDVRDRLSVRVEPASKIKVNQIEVPEFVYSTVLPRIAGLVSLYNPSQKGPSSQPTFDEADNDTIIELVRTTDDRTNEGIMNLAEVYEKQFGGDLFQDAWKLLKLRNEFVNDTSVTYQSFMVYLTAFLIVDKLEKEPIQGMRITEEELKQWAMFFKVACSRIINSFSSMYSTAIASKAVISSVNTKTKTIYVYHDTYANIDLPNKADILVGIMNSSNPTAYRNLDAITENAEELARHGQLVLATVNTIDKTRLAARTFDAITSSILALVENTFNDEHAELKAVIEEIPVLEYRGKINHFLNNYYPGNRILDVDLAYVVSDTVCDLFFKDTMASLILKHLIVAESSKQDLDTSTIVSTAIINILIEWVAGQIEVVKG